MNGARVATDARMLTAQGLSRGQEWMRSPSFWRMKRNHGIPAWADFATDPGTSK
jgi:hypothetical protein